MTHASPASLCPRVSPRRLDPRHQPQGL